MLRIALKALHASLAPILVGSSASSSSSSKGVAGAVGGKPRTVSGGGVGNPKEAIRAYVLAVKAACGGEDAGRRVGLSMMQLVPKQGREEAIKLLHATNTL